MTSLSCHFISLGFQICKFVTMRSAIMLASFHGKHFPPSHLRLALLRAQSLKGSLVPIVNHFSILRKINNNNFSQCPSAQHLLILCKQLVYCLAGKISMRINNNSKRRFTPVGEGGSGRRPLPPQTLSILVGFTLKLLSLHCIFWLDLK